MGESMRRLRKDAGLTQQEAADRIGVGQSTVAMWETGNCLPRMNLLKKIAEVYGCKMADLLDEEN